MIKRAFTEHPSSVGESYLQHLACAFGFSLKMIGGGIACLLHGLLPFLFVRTGSKCIDELHHRMVTHRDRRFNTTEAELPAMKQDSANLGAAE